MRVLTFAISGVIAMSLALPATAATSRGELTWEQCHIQTLRHGFTPYQRAYVDHMMHCLAGKARK